jgi:hypothetical protein
MLRSVMKVIVLGAVLAGCGGSGSSGDSAKLSDSVNVPGIAAGSTFSFDLGIVVNGKYYVTDRNNKAVDVYDIATRTLTLITGTGANAFAGCSPTANCVGANNGISGPDGINYITGTNFMYVGDVDSVKVLDISTQKIVKTIKVSSVGFRADEGCYDADDHLYMISTPDADQPFATFINTDTQTVVATVKWVDTNGKAAGGNEQCQYDHASHSFLVNNDNTVANPHGEVDVIPASSITTLAPGSTVNVFSLAGVLRFPLGNCDPTGMDLGPAPEMIVECRQGDAGHALTTLIMNRNTGAVIATLPVGGGDQVAYDARTNKYYVAGGRWHESGVNDAGGGCSAANPCVPTLFVIDATSHQVVKRSVVGNNAHSVAVDPVTGLIFMPYSSATAPGGCPICTTVGLVNGGIEILTL